MSPKKKYILNFGLQLRSYMCCSTPVCTTCIKSSWKKNLYSCYLFIWQSFRSVFGFWHKHVRSRNVYIFDPHMYKFAGPRKEDTDEYSSKKGKYINIIFSKYLGFWKWIEEIKGYPTIHSALTNGQILLEWWRDAVFSYNA